MTKKLKKILAQTLNSWSDEVSNSFIENKGMMEFLEKFKNCPPSPPRKPDPWEDNTPFEKCNWFVVTQEDCGYSCHIDGFKTRKKAELFMKEYADVYPCLIRGRFVK